ncbi:MAG: SoxR reducing system RseC family protein [Candidatus Brocadiaceae bacterium]|nr:SoxR reducing system RseC family protein [Candidatus Brocadiaceae bacterium]
METLGKIVSITGTVAEVCILKKHTSCGNCSTCIQKISPKDLITVASINGIHVGLEVMIRDNKNWFIRNKTLFSIVAFIFGIVFTEAILYTTNIAIHNPAVDLLIGGICSLIVFIVAWIKKPQYLYKIEFVREGRPNL